MSSCAGWSLFVNVLSGCGLVPDQLHPLSLLYHPCSPADLFYDEGRKCISPWIAIQVLQSAALYTEQLYSSPFQTYVLNQFSAALLFQLSRERAPSMALWAKSLCDGAEVYLLPS